MAELLIRVGRFTLRDEGGAEVSVHAETMAEARAKADAFAREGGYDTSAGTVWIDTWVTSEDGESERVTTRIDPPAPACAGEHEHDWQAPIELVGGVRENPGVRGHGGGVTVKQVCMHCGTVRLTDTWAQRPDTGEQGLESVSYDKGRWQREVTTADVVLTSAAMGDVTEADYDAWITYVNEHIDEATGLVVSVDAKPFGEPGEDAVTAALGDNVETVREALRDLWDRWCSEGAPGVEP